MEAEVYVWCYALLVVHARQAIGLKELDYSMFIEFSETGPQASFPNAEAAPDRNWDHLNETCCMKLALVPFKYSCY